LLSSKTKVSYLTHLEDFRKAVRQDDIDGLNSSYRKYQESIQFLGKLESGEMDSGDVRDGLAVVSARKRLTAKDFRFGQKLFNDLERNYRMRPSALDHRLLITTMIKSGRTLDALRWIERMQGSFGVRPKLEDWLLVLQGFSKDFPSRPEPDLERIRQVLKTMQKNKIVPSIECENILLQALFDTNPNDPSIIEDCLLSISDFGLDPNLDTWTILLNGYTEHKMMAEAGTAYETVRGLAVKGMASTKCWNARLKYCGAIEGYSEVLAEFRQWLKTVKKENMPDEWTLAYLALCNPTPLYGKNIHPLEQVKSIFDNNPIRKDFDIKTPLAAHAVLLQRLLREAPDPALGFQVAQWYYQSLTQGPDAVRAHPTLLLPLLRHACEVLSPPQLKAAQELYQDWVNPLNEASSEALEQSSEEDYSPDLSVFVSLLKACAKSGREGLEWAFKLLEDMQSDGLLLEPSSLKLDLIVKLMSNAPNHAMAFKVYAWIHALDPTSFSRADYNVILSAFAKLSFPDPNSSPTKPRIFSAPPELFLEMLRDMRASGSSPDTFTYTLLLSYYSKSYRRADQIARLHDIIKLDPQYDPDIVLNNALIKAYGYASSYDAAFRTWQSMLANRHRPNKGIDNRTISCILDVCGWSKRYDKAVQIWEARKQDPILQLNKKNWDTWVENLCRMDRLNEAANCVFDEMKHNSNQADGSTLEILFKFARRTEDEHVYSSMVKRARKHFPKLMENQSVPRIVYRNKSDPLVPGSSLGATNSIQPILAEPTISVKFA